MLLTNAVLSAALNVVILAGLPFFFYFVFHKWRHKRSFGEIARRAGLQLGEVRYIGYCLLLAVAVVVAVLLWAPPVEIFQRQGSPQRVFVGLGLTGTSIAMALLYGVIKTGFSEELLFRGLIAGSLGRRLPLIWANLIQALIFLAPHLLILKIKPEMWGILPIVFVTSLFKGWVRIRSGSIVGPWLLHAAGNITMCLYVATRAVT